MKRYSAQLDFSSPPAGSFESLSINLPQGAGESGSLTVFGDEVQAQARVGLTALTNGAVDSAASWGFHTPSSIKSGSDGFMSRVRSVELADYSHLLNEPAELPQQDTEPTARVGYTLLPLEAPLGSYLPTAEDCEAEGRLGAKSNVSFCREMLAASNSVSLMLYPGPGLVERKVPQDYDVTGQTVGDVLNELLLTNGVRWWLEEDVLVVDGRSLPLGDLVLTGTDAEGARVEYREEPGSAEPEPQLADFLARCNESIESEDGQGGTFETFENGTYTSTGEVSDAGAPFSATTTITKEDGQVVREVTEGRGLLTYPNNEERIGPKYRKVTTKEYHSTVKEALLHSTEAVYAYADCADLYEASGITEGLPAFNYEGAKVRPAGVPAYIYSTTYRVWESLLRQSPYLTKLTKVNQVWHAEGWLRHRTELTREFQGFLIDEDLSPAASAEDDLPFEIRFLYRDTVTETSWVPIGNGLWLESGTTMERVDRPIIQNRIGAAFTGDLFGVSTSSQATPFSRVSDQPPETVSLPEPECTSLPCSQQANQDYQDALADWNASASNGAGRRAYTVNYNHLRLNLRRGSSLGGGLILDVSHSIGRNQPGGTTAQVWKAL